MSLSGKRMKIAILSRNPQLYSTRRLVEAAEKHGHEAHVVDHLRCNIEIEQKGHPCFTDRSIWKVLML